MDAVKRLLRESGTAPSDPPSPSGSTTTPSPSAHSPSSPRDSAGGEVEVEAGPSTNQTPWYRISRRDHPKSRHGYEPYRLSIQGAGGLRLAECVSFWPFCSPEHFAMAESRWDDMEGVFAIGSYGRVIVARVSDDGYEELWTYETAEDNIYHVTWSYDPITLRPILASGGKARIVWLFDHWQKAPYRIFQGHGDEILSLAFHPLHPHILASASSDKTIRIWNIYGTDVELEEGDTDPLSENYPQGDADEGSCALAILAGDKSGHKAGVAALAFHPHHNAIASGGTDHHVKIWPLPPIPDPDPTMPPTRRGHRPLWIHQPLFSTDRLHGAPLDCIGWLNKDTLLTRAGAEICGWKWLGYKSCFRPDQMEPYNTTVLHSDRISSHSYSISLDILEEASDWFWRAGLHLAFDPTDDEVDFATVDLVTDTIFAYPVRGFPPRIHLVNPLAWDPGPYPPPLVDGYRRALTPDQHGDVWEPSGLPGCSDVLPIEIDLDGIDDEMEREEGHMRGDIRQKHNDKSRERDDLESVDGVWDDDNLEEDDAGDGEADDARNRSMSRRSKRKIDDSSRNSPSDPTASHSGRGREVSKSNDTPILPTPTSIIAPTPTDTSIQDNSTYAQNPWSLIVRAKDLEKAFMMSKISASDKRELKRSKKLLACVSISPRGAKWVVAVGFGETIAIWRLRDKAPDS